MFNYYSVASIVKGAIMLKKKLQLIILLSVITTLALNFTVYADNDYNSLLFEGVKTNKLSKVKEALENGANISARNDKGETPLKLAVAQGYFGLVEFLHKEKRLKLILKIITT